MPIPGFINVLNLELRLVRGAAQAGASLPKFVTSLEPKTKNYGGEQ